MSRFGSGIAREGSITGRRVAVIAVITAVGVLGFFQGSAVGGHTSHAIFPTTEPRISVSSIFIPTTIVTVPPTTTTPTLTIATILTVPTLSLSIPTTTAPSTTVPTLTTTTTAPATSEPVSVSTPATTSEALPVIATEPASTTTVPFLPPVKTSLSVAVSGGGTVTGTGISCGAAGSKCFGSFKPGTKVALHAGAAHGSRFTGWSGGCKGVSLVCLVSLAKAASVVATFAPTGGDSVPVSISRADFDVQWQQSLGSGKLDVKGKIAKPALVAIQLHRAGGSKVLLTTNLSLPAGPFSLSVRLLPGLLADGQPLLPGGFVVSISGHSGKAVVPTQLRTIELTPPPQGVVGKAFASSSAGGGPQSTIPASSRSAFVHFVFQSLPSESQKLTVAWYRPGGKLLGVATKSSEPTVTTSISSKAPLPAGNWRVDLRAGSTVVKSVPIVVR